LADYLGETSEGDCLTGLPLQVQALRLSSNRSLFQWLIQRQFQSVYPPKWPGQFCKWPGPTSGGYERYIVPGPGTFRGPGRWKYAG